MKTTLCFVLNYMISEYWTFWGNKANIMTKFLDHSFLMKPKISCVMIFSVPQSIWILYYSFFFSLNPLMFCNLNWPQGLKWRSYLLSFLLFFIHPDSRNRTACSRNRTDNPRNRIWLYPIVCILAITWTYSLCRCQ